jgi:oligopeptide/dipeptide ABC transporter, ATP-binding protein, C-terminal domain
MSTNILEVENLRMYYKTKEGYVRAVDDVSFDLSKGDFLGIAGESASGKTSLAMTIMRLLPTNAEIKSGKILLDGMDILSMKESELRKIRWTKISLVPQGSMNSLNPVFNIGSQIVEGIVEHKLMDKKAAWKRAEELLELVGIERNRIKSYPHELSGGMKQRVAIAMALSNNPDIVILDEPTTALDVIVQANIMNLLRDLKSKLNMTMILVTHDLSIIADLCNKVIIYYAGKIAEMGSILSVYSKPLHPYTQGLLASFPNIRAKRQKLSYIPGTPPNLINPPKGCRFHPRCPFAFERCRVEEPQLREIEPGHYVACHLY